jgi:hypothetical protein
MDSITEIDKSIAPFSFEHISVNASRSICFSIVRDTGANLVQQGLRLSISGQVSKTFVPITEGFILDTASVFDCVEIQNPYSYAVHIKALCSTGVFADSGALPTSVSAKSRAIYTVTFPVSTYIDLANVSRSLYGGMMILGDEGNNTLVDVLKIPANNAIDIKSMTLLYDSDDPVNNTAQLYLYWVSAVNPTITYPIFKYYWQHVAGGSDRELNFPFTIPIDGIIKAESMLKIKNNNCPWCLLVSFL